MTYDQLSVEVKRKPSQKWFFKDNSITGINASQDYEGGWGGLILPYKLTDEQRDTILWAYEQGQRQGGFDAETKMKADMKKLLGITDPYVPYRGCCCCGK